MFDPFKMWDEMLDIYRTKDEDTVETVYLEFEVPKDMADEVSAKIANMLSDNGYDPEGFYAG